MTIKNLSDISFETILECFLKAFENYFVELPTDKQYYAQRWKAAKVNFTYSYGMLDGDQLVGFILHAIDKRRNQLIAYNAGTGVIPEFRGKRIVSSMYKHALNHFRENDIDSIVLEVITKNDIAIKAYENIGFEKRRKYNCFNGKIRLYSIDEVELEELDLKDVDWNSLPNQELYSWDNQKESVMLGNYRFFQIINKAEPESFFIINTEINYVAQFDLFESGAAGWLRLFSGIKTISETIKINNVDYRLKEKQKVLSSIGLKNTVDQFEMELGIKDGSKFE